LEQSEYDTYDSRDKGFGRKDSSLNSSLRLNLNSHDQSFVVRQSFLPGAYGDDEP
jgi:hypothetical protein